MKRKLDENDTPASIPQADQPGESGETLVADPSFSDLGLDSRLLQAIAQQKYQKPTLVQSKAIPLALNGVDVLAKSKTGSGKTLAYVLPILHSIAKRKQV